MNKHKKLIETILDKVKDFDEGLLIPKKIEIKINEIENFNLEIVKELSLIDEPILNRSMGFNNEILSTDNYSVQLIIFDNENNSIRFYPTALKNYLKNKL